MILVQTLQLWGYTDVCSAAACCFRPFRGLSKIVPPVRSMVGLFARLLPPKRECTSVVQCSKHSEIQALTLRLPRARFHDPPQPYLLDLIRTSRRDHCQVLKKPSRCTWPLAVPCRTSRRPSHASTMPVRPFPRSCRHSSRGCFTRRMYRVLWR